MNNDETLMLFEIANYALQNDFDGIADYLDLDDDELQKLFDKLTTWLEDN